MYHVWWSCPKVRRFWIRMFNLIYSMTGQNIPRRAKTGLFSDLLEEIPRHLRTPISFILLVAKITIARACCKLVTNHIPQIPDALLPVRQDWDSPELLTTAARFIINSLSGHRFSTCLLPAEGALFSGTFTGHYGLFSGWRSPGELCMLAHIGIRPRPVKILDNYCQIGRRPHYTLELIRYIF